MSKAWLQTYPGNRRFDLLDRRVEDVDVLDLASHLSGLCRYTGGVPVHYSVAEHCVRVSVAVERNCTDAGLYGDEARLPALQALLHDAAEAYVGDVSNPLKVALRQLTWEALPDVVTEGKPAPRGLKSVYDLLEDRVQRLVAARFKVAYPWHAIVTHFDLVLLATEKRDLLGPEPEPWSIPSEIQPLEERIVPWSRDEARARWLGRLYELGGDR